MTYLSQRRSQDYIRHGTTSLFAALDVATGRVIGEMDRCRSSIEFRSFLETVDREVPQELEIHLILDNYGSHSERWIRRGAHRSTRQLEEASKLYLRTYNEDPRPFKWHKTANEMLAVVAVFCRRISESGH